MPDIFRGRVPDDRLYCPRHDMWVKPEGELLLVGATSFGIFLAGEVIAFTAKPRGAEVDIHRGLGTVECRKTVLAVHAPVSLQLVEGNEAAEERPAVINLDPYGEGWMVRARATRWAEECGTLVDAAAYRAHVLSVEPEACFV
jgi:glycine cleavage system H protein